MIRFSEVCQLEIDRECFRHLAPLSDIQTTDDCLRMLDQASHAVHVDVDLYQPTRDSIDFFYPRLNPGGLFVCDDYGFTTCPGATKAIDDFMADKPETIVSMDAGGCFFVKT